MRTRKKQRRRRKVTPKKTHCKSVKKTQKKTKTDKVVGLAGLFSDGWNIWID